MPELDLKMPEVNSVEKWIEYSGSIIAVNSLPRELDLLAYAVADVEDALEDKYLKLEK